MSSIQFHMLRRIMLFLQGRYSEKAGNIRYIRKMMDKGSERFRIPDRVDILNEDWKHVPVEWYRPHDSDERFILMYLHGGGYAAGSFITHRSMLGKLAIESGIDIVSIGYRLSPEHPFPAALDDAMFAFEWIMQLGYDSQNILIGGDSAGGGLSLATMLRRKELGMEQPRAAILLSPWTDLMATGESVKHLEGKDPMILVSEITKWAQLYAGDEPLDHPLISPLYADLRGLPEMLIQVGTHEVLLDDSTRFAELARDAGVKVTLEVWDDMIHVWPLFWSIFPEGLDGVEAISDYIRKVFPVSV